jgi:hypothetical protein
MTGTTRYRTAALGAVGLVLAGSLAAQNPPPEREQNPAAAGRNAPRPTAGQVVGGGTAQYLVENPGVLHLTPVQVERIRKVSTKVEELNTPVWSQIERLTGGRPFRELPPADRRRVGPQVRPLLLQLQANNTMSLDSIEAILTPDQTNQLENLREDYKQRRAEMRPRLDSARARGNRRRP